MNAELPTPTVPRVSVVVIGRNEGDRLVRCLESVSTMNRPAGGIEIIYVDSNSTDDSVERARELGATVIAVESKPPNPAAGRNAGWRAARGAFVLFLDGDTRLDPDFVNTALAEFKDDAIAVVWGNRREIHPENSIYNRVLDLDWISPAGVSDSCGGDAVIRRSVLETVRGFDERLMAGEVPELCRRMRELGHLIRRIDVPMTGHDFAMTGFGQYWKRARRTGYALAEISMRYRKTTLPLPEARENLIRGAIYVACIPGVIALSGLLQSFLPVGVLLVLFLALSLLTAFNARWKSAGFLTSLLYGMHVQFQQIPIFLGQLDFSRDVARGVRRARIEYK